MTESEQQLLDFLNEAKSCFGDFELEVVMCGVVYRTPRYERKNKTTGTWVTPCIVPPKKAKNGSE